MEVTSRVPSARPAMGVTSSPLFRIATGGLEAYVFDLKAAIKYAQEQRAAAPTREARRPGPLKVLAMWRMEGHAAWRACIMMLFQPANHRHVLLYDMPARVRPARAWP